MDIAIRVALLCTLVSSSLAIGGCYTDAGKDWSSRDIVRASSAAQAWAETASGVPEELTENCETGPAYVGSRYGVFRVEPGSDSRVVDREVEVVVDLETGRVVAGSVTDAGR